jgi:hypothetical protein
MPKKNVCLFKWDAANDSILSDLAQKKTEKRKWSHVAEQFKNQILATSPPDTKRVYPTRKQCRERWTEYLDPRVSRDKFTLNQMNYIIEKKAAGWGFADIAKQLNHPANQVKNAYYAPKPKRRKCTDSFESKKSASDQLNSADPVQLPVANTHQPQPVETKDQKNSDLDSFFTAPQPYVFFAQSSDETEFPPGLGDLVNNLLMSNYEFTSQ